MPAAPNTPAHIPVLPQQVLHLLDPQPGQIYLDGTAGLAGHARLIAQRLGPAGTLILMDLDVDNLAQARANVESAVPGITVHAIHASYVEAPRRLNALNLQADLMLLDLGFASNQVDDPSRGLSFRHDGPLDMRLDPSQGAPASDLLNTRTESEIGEILRDFGEERAWRKIARKLVEARQAKPIQSTGELANIVRAALGAAARSQRIDPATRTFQALRIAVNDEMGHLEAILGSIQRAARTGQPGTHWLAPHARIAVISFHSLEDRPVKRAFASIAQQGFAQSLTRKPVSPDDDERARNPRARSAKLRAIALTSD